MFRKLMEGTGRGYVTLEERNVAKTDPVICMKTDLNVIDWDNYIVPVWMI